MDSAITKDVTNQAAAQGRPTRERSPAMRLILESISRTMPIILGYVPVGFAYGVLADQAGMAAYNVLLMSVLVFAGSAQLVAVGMLAAGASPLAVVVTTFIVNLRHMLMSASLAPHMRHWKKWQLAVFAHELTDESFALHSLRFAEGDKRKGITLGINVTAQISWVAGSLLGLVSSGFITDVGPIGLDYALPAMFIALLMAQIKNPRHVLSACAAGLAAVGLALVGLDQWNVMLATILAATLALGVEQWTRR